jgi:hypothetical protein
MAPFKSKEYYEEQLQRKVLYVPNLSMFLVDLHKQVLKLPHEAFDEKLDANVGMTYSDILQSFCNGVDVLYSILQPVRSMAGPKYPKCPVEESTDFKLALKKLDWCYGIMDDMDVLNDHTVVIDMPDENESYDTEAVKNVIIEPTGALPAPIITPDVEAVGELVGEDGQRVAEESVEEALLRESKRDRDSARAAGFR